MSSQKRGFDPATPVDDALLLKAVAEAYQATPNHVATDDFVVGRVVARVGIGNGKRKRFAQRVSYATLLAVVGVTGGAAAAAVSVPLLRGWLQPTAPAVVAPKPRVVFTPSPSVSAPLVPPPVVPERVAPRSPPAPSQPAVAPVQPNEEPDAEVANPAAALFEHARKARALGWHELAAKQFQALIDGYPESPEADISRLAAGRLYLRLNQHASALKAFSSYVQAHPEGALQEEALAGVAQSLTGLGRQADADAAWKALRDAHPQSPYLQTHRP